MNCADAESLLFAERDRELTVPERAELDIHLAGCAGCRQLRSDLAIAAEQWRGRTARAAVPDAGNEWRKLRAQLPGPDVRTTPKRRLAPVIWLTAPLAAAAALALVFFVSPRPVADDAAIARADYVEATDASASTLVYADKESGWLVVWAADTRAGSDGRG